jgi:choline-glycine betaine transporter
MQSATILVATPFLLVLVAISVNLVRELRKEPYTSTLDPQVRRAVLAHSHQGNPANGRVLDLTSPDDTSRRTPLARQ